MSVDDFLAKYRPLIQPLSNGNGLFFVRCHCCHATSPSCTVADDLRILADAQAVGWLVVKAGTGYRLFCNKPRCQMQGGV